MLSRILILSLCQLHPLFRVDTSSFLHPLLFSSSSEFSCFLHPSVIPDLQLSAVKGIHGASVGSLWRPGCKPGTSSFFLWCSAAVCQRLGCSSLRADSVCGSETPSNIVKPRHHQSFSQKTGFFMNNLKNAPHKEAPLHNLHPWWSIHSPDCGLRSTKDQRHEEKTGSICTSLFRAGLQWCCHPPERGGLTYTTHKST